MVKPNSDTFFMCQWWELSRVGAMKWCLYLSGLDTPVYLAEDADLSVAFAVFQRTDFRRTSVIV